MRRISEKKVMAIINLTCDYPNEYSVPEIARWVDISIPKVWQLVKLLGLDIRNQGRGRVWAGNLKVDIPIKQYENKYYELLI